MDYFLVIQVTKIGWCKKKMKICEYLKMKRLELGLSQRKFAELAGMKFQNYQKYERGEIVPTLQTLKKITEVYGIKLSETFEEIEKLQGGM